jgi:hypothetical protein
VAFVFDYTSILYGPVYSSLGVPAVLTLDDSAGTTIDLTVIDKTAGEDVSQGQIALQTIRPVAYVRANELSQNHVAYDQGDLEGSMITFNSNTWRIESHQPKPSPGGEGDGEIMLILIGG